MIEANNFSVRFGANFALESLSFAVEEGSFVAVIGPNGAGKSTLLRSMLGLVSPASGEILVMGKSPSLDLPAGIGYVPQVKTLDRTFPALGIELVVAGLRSAWPARIKPAERDRAMEIMRRVGAENLAKRSIGQLSGGELQRVYLARGLAHAPRLILLDEPATGMDLPSESDMYHVLERYQKETNATVVMITHDWGAALHHASHVMVMNRKLVSFGPPEEALGEEYLREAFGHRGHSHAMRLGAQKHG
ncbi:metal ABC transporter ATP-binding protein [Candidatus Sumerlaeota bacterium]|nr:metal ABC transporter ATP-binding protein [Candidatus Sumerlaeota bacterium]